MPTSFAETRKQLFFDLDDTLIDDGYKFEITSSYCALAIILAFETRAPAMDEIINEYRTIDNQRLATLSAEEKFAPTRIAGSWRACYDHLCDKYGVRKKESCLKLLEGYTLRNFEPPYFIIPGAIDTLNDIIHTNRFELRLLSSGNPIVQERKITETGLKKYFTTEHFYSDGEKIFALERGVRDFGARNVWMVGNSMGFDINPALTLGANAIYIPRGSWHASLAEPINDKYTELKDIRDLPLLLNNWK